MEVPGGPVHRRIIPARAGPTRVRISYDFGVPDHPRSCGANRLSICGISPSPGSSPLVRGQRFVATRHLILQRIIPARAGPTTGHAAYDGQTADHPRSCGANAQDTRGEVSGLGSSPLVRGQPVQPESVMVGERIIPARAGPTPGHGAVPYRGADHPRSCGANQNNDRIAVILTGSSPLVRGQLRSCPYGQSTARIIPARAGPTGQSVEIQCDRPDHPRSCGANLFSFFSFASTTGSSPLVRGQRRYPTLS